jgi:hypothetical protein
MVSIFVIVVTYDPLQHTQWISTLSCRIQLQVLRTQIHKLWICHKIFGVYAPDTQIMDLLQDSKLSEPLFP